MASNDKGLEEIPESTLSSSSKPAKSELSRRRLALSPLPAHEANVSLCIAQIESNYDEVTDSFDSMSLKAELLRGALADVPHTGQEVLI